MESEDVSHETKTEQSLRFRISRYVRAMEDRDLLVKDLTAHGWGPSSIARTLGMGRTTVGRILGKAWPYNHGKTQRTEVRHGHIHATADTGLSDKTANPLAPDGPCNRRH